MARRVQRAVNETRLVTAGLATATAITIGLGFLNPISFALVPVFIAALVVERVLAHRRQLVTDTSVGEMVDRLAQMESKVAELDKVLIAKFVGGAPNTGPMMGRNF